MKTWKDLIFALVFLLIGSTLIMGCQRNEGEITADNLVSAGDPLVDRSIGDETNRYTIIGKKALERKARRGEIALVNTSQAIARLEELTTVRLPSRNVRARSARSEAVAAAADDQNSLVLGFPAGLLNERQVFGAVVTKVSDNKSESLGRLRLTDLTPIHARAVVGKGDNNQYVFALVGCPNKCNEASDEAPFLGVPVVGVDEKNDLILVDLAPLGKELNLIAMQDPQGLFTQLKTKSSKTTAFDYSLSTLVFDVESTMIPLSATETTANPPETVFTVRWYLKLLSGFNPAFVTRPAAKGVGFFMTERSEKPLIQRFSRPIKFAGAEGGQVKYYLKNVPPEHRASFSGSFDGWNDLFVEATGKKLLSYEFIEKTDPRYNLIVAGDIRYNVLEWDLDNLAPYGGFGPSSANQYTGEIMSANVLVQGPKIIEGYKKWFESAVRSDELRRQGRIAEADQLMVDVARSITHREEQLKALKLKMSLGGLEFTIRSQLPQFEDPAFQRADFEAPPAGFTFETYMDGYFHDMVEHELGHNLGLRHNFRGNLGAESTPALKGVSRSIMEYLGKAHRHLDRIGPYDLMAIKYGYIGELPKETGHFCTDEDVADFMNPFNSAECSRDDATPDPFGYFESQLVKATRLLVAKGSTETPVWSVPDMDREVTTALSALALYAMTADISGSTWTNFFNGGDRPTSPAGVKEYVQKKLKGTLCAAELNAAIEEKTSEAAKEKAKANLDAIREKTTVMMEMLGIFQPETLKCQ